MKQFRTKLCLALLNMLSVYDTIKLRVNLRDMRIRRKQIQEWQFDFLEDNDIVTEEYMNSMDHLEYVNRWIAFYVSEMTKFQKLYVKYANVMRGSGDDQNKLWFYDP